MAAGTLRTANGGQDGITPDQRAILGQAGPEGFYLACGFSGTGFKTAPAIGNCMTELILDGRATTVDISAYGLHRFAAGRELRVPPTVAPFNASAAILSGTLRTGSGRMRKRVNAADDELLIEIVLETSVPDVEAHCGVTFTPRDDYFWDLGFYGTVTAAAAPTKCLSVTSANGGKANSIAMAVR